MITLGDLFLLTAFCLMLSFWWRAQRTRELALAATQRALREQDLSLLDGNVAMKALWCKRDSAGNLRLWRRYHFEFTVTGHERYQGYIVTLGNRTEHIHLDPHRIPDQHLH